MNCRSLWMTHTNEYCKASQKRSFSMPVDFYNASLLQFGHFGSKNSQRYLQSSLARTRGLISWRAGDQKIQKRLCSLHVPHSSLSSVTRDQKLYNFHTSRSKSTRPPIVSKHRISATY